MTDAPHADMAARVLRARSQAADSRVTRDVGIGLVAHAMSLAKRRRQLRQALGGGLFAAAAALALVLAWPRAQPAVTTTAQGCCAGVASGAVAARERPRAGSLRAGQTLVAPADAPARAALPSGTRLELAAGGAVACRDDGSIQRLLLEKGSLHLEVNKLDAGERFLVSTPDSEVEVRGTVFDVTVEAASEACAARTSVSVEHGVVEARFDGSRVVLRAGERWSSPCTERPAALAPSEAPRHVVHPPASGVTRATSSDVVAEVTPPSASFAAEEGSSPARIAASSLLREQNDLYAEAETARRAGRDDEALKLYTSLLTRFERGPLTESATVGRVRALSRLDPARAKTEAERYLARFPLGFARAEMGKLTGAP